MGLAGFPKYRVHYGQLGGGIEVHLLFGHHHVLVPGADAQDVARLGVLGYGRDGDDVFIDVGRVFGGFDIARRHFFQPDRLPDTRYGRVPDAPRILDLLATRLRAVAAGIPHAQRDFLLFAFF